MDVPGAQASCIEERWRQDQAVGGNDQRVGCYCPDPGYVVGAQPLWLAERQTSGKRKLLDGAGCSAQPSSRRPIGLRQYKANVMAAFGKPPERNRCELRRAGED
jgi:hypothetical protein